MNWIFLKNEILHSDFTVQFNIIEESRASHWSLHVHTSTWKNKTLQNYLSWARYWATEISQKQLKSRLSPHDENPILRSFVPNGHDHLPATRSLRSRIFDRQICRSPPSVPTYSQLPPRVAKQQAILSWASLSRRDPFSFRPQESPRSRSFYVEIARPGVESCSSSFRIFRPGSFGTSIGLFCSESRLHWARELCRLVGEHSALHILL